MICPNCGKEISDSNEICKYCGIQVPYTLQENVYDCKDLNVEWMTLDEVQREYQENFDKEVEFDVCLPNDIEKNKIKVVSIPLIAYFMYFIRKYKKVFRKLIIWTCLGGMIYYGWGFAMNHVNEYKERSPEIVKAFYIVDDAVLKITNEVGKGKDKVTSMIKKMMNENQ